jgi:hypothetical protein
MIRGGRVPWRLDDDEPASRPLYRTVVWVIATGSVVWAVLLAGLVWRLL